jgi:hypothetical protein
MFKKLSLTKLIINLEIAIRRFPLAALIAACAATTSIILIHIPRDYAYIWDKILIVLILSFPLFISSTLLYETKFNKKKYKYIFDLLIVIFITIYYLMLPKDVFSSATESRIFIRHILLTLSAILTIIFIGFLNKSQKLISTFWQYNKSIVFSLILTVIYVVAIGLGLTIALGSVDQLFDLDINPDRYVEIWTILWSLFAPLFFLSRIPKKIFELQEEDKKYPRELRFFVQFVLLSLVSIYFLILYIYSFKVVISWEWPKGILAYMISGFSFLGVITYALLYPLRTQYVWAKKFGYIFFAVLIPQVGMLFWALWFRISKYSITENRALIFIFGCWLLGMAVYFLISKRKDIRLIPITLFIILILFSFGPWSIFNISRKFQTNRLMDILGKYNTVSYGKIIQIPESESISKDDKKEISEIVSYLYDTHGREYLQKFFNQSIQKNKEGSDELVYLTKSEIVENLIGIDYITKSNFNNISEYFSITSETVKFYDISGFDYMMNIKGSNTKKSTDNGYEYYVKNKTSDFEITKNNKVIISYNFDKLIQEILEESDDTTVKDVDLNKMIIVGDNNQISYKIYLTNINGRRFIESNNEEKYDSFNINGIFFFSEK